MLAVGTENTDNERNNEKSLYRPACARSRITDDVQIHEIAADRLRRDLTLVDCKAKSN